MESAVQVSERWILARLRHRTFFSLESLNAAIAELLEDLNDAPFQKRPGSRRSVFEELDRPALRPLLRERFVLQEWSRRRAHIDYHLTIDEHHYSVPHQLITLDLDVRATSATIEVFHDGQRVASHARSYRRGGFTTVREHMPPAHQEVAGVNQQSLLRSAARVGPAARAFAQALLNERSVPQQAFRPLQGILRLERDFGRDRLNAACERALLLRAFSYRSVHSILTRGLDRLQPTTGSDTKPKPQHENLRGHSYYSPDTAISDHHTSSTNHEITKQQSDAIEANSHNHKGVITC